MVVYALIPYSVCTNSHDDQNSCPYTLFGYPKVTIYVYGVSGGTLHYEDSGILFALVVVVVVLVGSGGDFVVVVVVVDCAILLFMYRI